MIEALNLNVLVLNKLWQPIQTCSVRRAVKLLCLGHAHVVEAEGDMKYQTHDLGSWLESSSERVAEEVIRSVRFANIAVRSSPKKSLTSIMCYHAIKAVKPAGTTL